MKNLQLLIYMTALLLYTSVGFAQQNKTHFNLDNDGLCLEGYDPVAYFKQNKAVEGKSSIRTKYEGVLYYFSSEYHKKVFMENPTQYIPQYGGWCAYAMGAKAEKVSVDPETFKIIDQKLYLFYNGFLNNTLTLWNKDQVNLLPKANENWLKELAK